MSGTKKSGDAAIQATAYGDAGTRTQKAAGTPRPTRFRDALLIRPDRLQNMPNGCHSERSEESCRTSSDLVAQTTAAKERVGFEPTWALRPNGLARRRLKPLGHLSSRPFSPFHLLTPRTRSVRTEWLERDSNPQHHGSEPCASAAVGLPSQTKSPGNLGPPGLRDSSIQRATSARPVLRVGRI